MITVKLKNKHEIPSRWSDFTPQMKDQFVALACAMDDFERGIFTFEQFKLCIVVSLLGIQLHKLKMSCDTFYENAFRISELVTFPYTLTDQEDGSKVVNVNVSLCRNILPELEGHKGYTLDVTPAGVVDCSLTAEQYVDALTLTDLYTKTRSSETLEQLVSLLYGSSRGISILEQTAVYYNFRGFLEWLHNLPQYALIFHTASKKPGAASPLGLSSSIFTVSKQGYGTLKEIKELDVFSYLGVLVQMSIDSIHQLAAVGLKPGEISEKTRIPIDLVLQHTTDPS